MAMKEKDTFWCWACKSEIPAGNFTPEGRHDEDKGGCGNYVSIKTPEQLAFEAGYFIGTMDEAFGNDRMPEDAYKEWKGGTK